MLCETHKLIAKKIYDILRSELGISLDCESLLRGSVAPDSNPLMVLIPHVKNKSIDFVNKQMLWLKSRSFPADTAQNRDYSYKLGIIIHFISDYFCRAHNHIKYLNPIMHFIYENRLRFYFRKNINITNLSSARYQTAEADALQDLINENHRIYTAQDISMENDLYYAVETALSISFSILSCSIEKSIPEFFNSQPVLIHDIGRVNDKDCELHGFI